MIIYRRDAINCNNCKHLCNRRKRRDLNLKKDCYHFKSIHSGEIKYGLRDTATKFAVCTIIGFILYIIILYIAGVTGIEKI